MGAPVDHHRILRLVGHGEAADVEALGRVPGVPSEPSRSMRPNTSEGVAQVQLGEAVGDGLPDDLPLVAGLLGAACADLDHGAQPVRGGARLLSSV